MDVAVGINEVLPTDKAEVVPRVSESTVGGKEDWEEDWEGEWKEV